MFRNRRRRLPNNTNTSLVNPRMYNRPTFVPSQGGSVGVASRPASSFYGVRVDTTARTEATKIVVFDASGGYQRSTNYLMPADVVITALSGPDYQFILNDLVSNASYFDIMKLTVAAAANQDQKAVQQFSRPIEVFSNDKGSSTHNMNTKFPIEGLAENQFQLNILTFQFEEIIDNRIALVYTQEAGITVDINFYQKAIVGARR